MLRLPIPLTDSVLLLAPRVGPLPESLQLPAALLLAAVPVALAVWLYRYELRLVRPAAAAGLLGLRLLALALVLFVTAFKPVWSRTVTETVPGRVVVALDRSASTTAADPQRPLPEKIKLAAALRVAVTDMDALPRSAVARRVLADDGVGLLSAVAGRHAVDLMTFARETADLPADALAGLPDAVPPGRAADATDVRLPLVRALERTGPDRGKVLGVVLLTDGRHNWGPPPVAKAAELGERGVPVYPVPLGPRTPPPDAAVLAVQAPPAVFKDADAAVEVRVGVAGLPAGPVKVTLTRPDEEPLEETLRHDGRDYVYAVRFRPRMAKVGTRVLTVAVAPVKGEVRSDNNRRSVTVNVADDKARVLLIDGEARWEYHYLASALERDKTTDLGKVVFAQPRLERIGEDELLKAGNPARTLPEGPEGLARFDCVVLGDVPPEQLPAAERDRLEKYVADRGGTLVVLAGKRAMPLAYAAEGDPLGRLLPIDKPRAVAPRDGFAVALTAEGRLSPFLQLEATPEQSDRRWAALPRHYWGVVGAAKPGAVPLAFVPPEGPADAGDRPDRERALIARHNYGFGRVLYVGLDSTWRWRFKAGDLYHHRFWGQVVRWAASDRPLVAGNDAVRFGPREPVYASGEEPEIAVRLGESAPKLSADALAAVRLWRIGDDGKEENAGLVPLARDARRPRDLTARLRDLTPGTYAVELAVPELGDRALASPGGDGKPKPLRASFTVSPPDSAEAVELGADWALLEDVAAKSGGRVFAPEDAAGLAELLVKQAATRSYPVETKLMQSWWTLWAFLILVTVEWVARKWAGLP